MNDQQYMAALIAAKAKLEAAGAVILSIFDSGLPVGTVAIINEAITRENDRVGSRSGSDPDGDQNTIQDGSN